MNPLGMVVALLGAMDHAAILESSNKEEIFKYTKAVQTAVYKAFQDGKGTRDLCGKDGLTTEQFVEYVAADLTKLMAGQTVTPAQAAEAEFVPSRKLRKAYKDID